FVQPLAKSRHCGLPRLGRHVVEKADHRPRRPVRLRRLRASRERPCGDAAHQGNELSALHWITLSARASTAGVMLRPRSAAARRLMTVSVLVGFTTGISAGLPPLRISAAERPICAYTSSISSP